MKNLNPSARWLKPRYNCMFQQDTDSKHTTQLKEEWMKQTNIKLQRLSPDLSPKISKICGLCQKNDKFN